MHKHIHPYTLSLHSSLLTENATVKGGENFKKSNLVLRTFHDLRNDNGPDGEETYVQEAWGSQKAIKNKNDLNVTPPSTSYRVLQVDLRSVPKLIIANT